MRNTGCKTGGTRSEGIERLLIFLFFTAGSVLAQLIFPAGWRLDEVFSAVFIYGVSFGAALVLSASVLGITLLPMCAFVFGAYSGVSAEAFVTAFLAGSEPDIRKMLVGVAAVPVFFVIAVRGMYTSEMLGTILDRSSASARTDYNREYIPITAAALAGMAAVYLLIG